ncbi:MAG: orotidine-5'-phosphate decarboxylase, partial [Pseudomonadota bacterium]|nr:orotidine-5'-phosphate decarboxylase [Pseudomonadota bacterium]
MPDPTLIIALDFHDARTALDFADRLNPDECRLKVGMELYTAAGPELIDTLARRGFDIFLDLKFHDIPNTVAAAVRVATGLGVWMVNVHALGGRRMLEAARDAVETSGSRTKLVAVTLLTSMNAEALAQLGWVNGFNESVLMLARLSA